jgi:hypothetical protein
MRAAAAQSGDPAGVANPAWKEALCHPTWNVLVVLAAAVGMPYLLLSTTGPLMQAWYARSFASLMPYRLYALSNLASMLALLSYPVLVEPYFPVREAGAGPGRPPTSCSSSPVSPAPGSRGRGLQRTEKPTHQRRAGATPGWGECLLWVGLAMTASILLLAMTRHLTQDVAPVPFLWVLPLSIYLLSFILCFDAPRYYYRPGFLVALPIAFLALDQVVDGGSLPVPLLVAAAVAVAVRLLHGLSWRTGQAPAGGAPPDLFYLMLSIGGALGGSFVGLLAPALFNAYFELPIGLFLCAAAGDHRSLARTQAGLALAAGRRPCSLRLSPGGISVDYVDDYRRVLRNFYGQLRVADVSDDDLGVKRRMVHGRINHGEQFISPRYSRRPTAYYCEQSGIGQALLSLTGGQR